MKRVWFAVAAALALTPVTAVAGTLADVHVISRSSGERLPVHAHGGKLYVAGQPGERYAVQVVNRSAGRILSVVSVDGVNVVSGESASPDQVGYVSSPWQSYEIAGWRKSADEVAAFYFTALPDSYAARTGRPNDVGVIGVAIFREWRPPHPRPQPSPYPREGAGDEASAGGKAERSQAPAAAAKDLAGSVREAENSGAPAQRRRPDKLGTGHGEREHSVVAFTDFRRATVHPSEVLTIYYDRYENLLARGIIMQEPRLAQPRPFPGTVRFAPDPG
ncbi:MAG: hypothetical protein IT530_16430 [Burkholderiales bacterium]|nr:hypothetical protein [Burkholderiales bacterium]